MDGPSEHSDSDSGESWTLLENNTVYADEPPDFLDDQERIGAQHHEKDEDTDGISIISDSDHEAPTPLPGDALHEKYEVQEETHLSEKDISDFVSVDPHLPTVKNNHEPTEDNEYLAESHVRHKTYVHRRNKQLSTVLNVIVLGSVITAAGVAIGHMWGAKHDCTMQTTSSINKILSNLYKLQEENAYLKAKIKELTQPYTHHPQQQKTPFKQNKCRKVFEESLNNNELRKFTKCVDENNKVGNNLVEHFTKPKPEKEFMGDMDKLKTVYLQNKSWLDDEISRRVKMEEELLKKYNDEINSAKEQFNKNDELDLILPNAEINKKETSEKIADVKNSDPTIFVQQKISYADSVKAMQKPKFKRNEERYEGDDSSEWSMVNSNVNFFDEDITPVDISPESDDQKEQAKIAHNEGQGYAPGYDTYYSGLTRSANSYPKEDVRTDDKIEEEIKFRRNEKRHETEDNSWLRYSQEAKNKWKKDKREIKRNSKKQRSVTSKSNSNNDKAAEFTTSEDEIVKDDRYVVNKLNKQKKKNGSNKNQKKKNKFGKWNVKGEFGDVLTPEYFTLNNPNKHSNSDYVPIVNNFYNPEKPPETLLDKGVNFEKKSDNKEQPGNWFEKRAELRTEARRKYYEQFGETSINNSSWYFRRMRKREQCRAKMANNTTKKLRKEKKSVK